MNTLTYTVPPALAGRSVKSILRGELRFSKARFQSLKWRDGAILLNGRPVMVDAVVRVDDVLTVALTERREPSGNITPCAFPLDIFYEDEYLLVLNKRAGLPMHPKAAESMAGALRVYLGGDAAAHFVNRLDKGTSGLCIAAKSGYVHDRFRAALHTDAPYREYRAFAEGRVEPTESVIELPIGPADGAIYKRCVRPDGQPARTEYTVLAQGARFAFLRLVPETGRTHQLRVHMAAIRHPLAGDSLYGAEDVGLIGRPALHSYTLWFTHPITGETLRFTAPLPEDMAALAGL